ncbi:MAG: hypothetical protein ABIE84_04375 [bacterium]
MGQNNEVHLLQIRPVPLKTIIDMPQVSPSQIVAQFSAVIGQGLQQFDRILMLRNGTPFFTEKHRQAIANQLMNHPNSLVVIVSAVNQILLRYVIESDIFPSTSTTIIFDGDIDKHSIDGFSHLGLRITEKGKQLLYSARMELVEKLEALGKETEENRLTDSDGTFIGTCEIITLDTPLRLAADDEQKKAFLYV